MFYLIHCDTFGCVNFQAIIGIANSKNGIMEQICKNKSLKNSENFEQICKNKSLKNSENSKPQYNIFDKNFHKKYKNIIKKSKQIII